MGYRKISLSLPLALAGLAATLNAAPIDKPVDPSSAVRSQLLRIPFAPATGRDLFYDVAITRFGPRSSITTSRQSLHFERSADGYSLTVTILRMKNGDEAFDLTTDAGRMQVPAQLRPFLLPMVVDVDAEGALVRVRNWPELKNAITDLPNLFAQSEQDPTKRDEARSVMARAMTPFLHLTAEQAPRALLKGWPDLFGLGGAELKAGVEYEGQSDEPSPMLPITVPMTLHFSLVREADSMLHYRLTSAPDPQTTAKVASEYLRNMAQDLPADKRANVEKAIEAMKSMTVSNKADVLFDPTTGLARRALLEKRVSMPDGVEGGERGERIEIQSVQ